MSLANEIIEEIHDVIPDSVEALIPDVVMGEMENAITHAVEELGNKIPDSLEKIVESAVDQLNN